MLHVYFPVGRERLTEIRNELAAEHGIWLFGGAKPTLAAIVRRLGLNGGDVVQASSHPLPLQELERNGALTG